MSAISVIICRSLVCRLKVVCECLVRASGLWCTEAGGIRAQPDMKTAPGMGRGRLGAGACERQASCNLWNEPGRGEQEPCRKAGESCGNHNRHVASIAQPYYCAFCPL